MGILATFAFTFLPLLVVFAVPGFAAERPVLIAVIAAKTGTASTSNKIIFEGARFAVKDINAAGGFKGHDVKILEFDNASTALGSKLAAKRAINDGVLAVVGASWSAHSIAMAPELQAAGVPMITPISTNQKVTLFGNYIFRACYTDPLQARVMARFAREDLKAKTAVTLVNASRTYSTNLGDFFEKSFIEMGGSILWRGEFLLDTADYKDLLEKASAYNPDVLYVPGDNRDSSFIIKQARERGLQATILGGDSFGLRLYDYIGDLADGCYYTTSWHTDSPLPQSREFVKRWEKDHGEIKQTTLALTYDSFMLLADAARRAETLTRENLRQALAETRNFPGVTGSISFDANGDPIKPVVINKLENGGATFIRNVSP